MINFLNIPIPREFCTFLKRNLGNNLAAVEYLYQELVAHEKIMVLAQKIWPKGDDGKKLRGLIRSMGWTRFRNNLASLYCHYLLYDRFPEEAHAELIEDVLDQEKKLMNYTVDGSSRLFMLLLYFKFSQIKSTPNSPYVHQIPESVFEALKFYGTKTFYIDWIIMLLWNFQHYMDAEDFLKQLKKRSKDYFGLFSQLSMKDRREMLSNLALYSYVVQEEDFFTKKLSLY